MRRFISTGTKLVSSCFPSKEQRHDKRLQNRMKLCALAIVLMWSSSLRTAVYISTFAIDVPSFDIVSSSCKSAISVTRDERDKFSTCVKVQVDQCENDLGTAIDLEMDRISRISSSNSEILNDIENTKENCVGNYTFLKRSLEGWVNELQAIPLNNNACNEEEREKMLNSIGDVDVLKAQAIAINSQFEVQSQNTVTNVVSYARKRARYDSEYFGNHTEKVRGIVKGYVNGIQLPQFPDIRPDLSAVDAAFYRLSQCLSPKTQNFAGKQKPVKCYPGYDVTLGDWIRPPIGGVNKVMLEFYEDYKDAWAKLINKYRERYIAAHNMVLEHIEAVEKQWAKVKEVFDGFNAWRTKGGFALNFVIGVLEVFTDWFRPILRISWSSLLPQPINIPSISISLPSVEIYWSKFDALIGFDGIDLIEKMWKAVGPVWDEFALPKYGGLNYLNAHVYQKIIDTQSAAIEKVKKTRDSIAQNVDLLIPADYNPPKYVSLSGNTGNLTDMEKDKENYIIMSEFFLNESNAAIDSVEDAKKKDTATNTTTAQEFNYTAFKKKFSNFDLSTMEFELPTLEFQFFDKIRNIADFVYILDLVFRTYFTIRLCFKYWDAGSIKLPTIDIRTEKEIINPLKLTTGRLVIHILTNPMVGAMIAALIATWTVSLTTSAYLPLYSEYSTGCIPSGGKGTFVSGNLYSSGYNYASRKGSASLIQKIEKIELTKTNTCSKEYITSFNKQNDDEDRLAKDVNFIESIAVQMALYDQCIDTDEANSQFRLACCNETGYDICDNHSTSVPLFSCPMNEYVYPPIAFSPPGEYLAHQSCRNREDGNEFDWDLDDAIFDCTKLPTCEFTCVGPHEEKIGKVTKECGCMSEWFFHSVLLRGLLSLLIFIIMNFSRSMFVDGLARVIWKSLHPGVYCVWATCDIDGRIDVDIKHNDIMSEDMSKEMDEDLYANDDHAFDMSPPPKKITLRRRSTINATTRRLHSDLSSSTTSSGYDNEFDSSSRRSASDTFLHASNAIKKQIDEKTLKFRLGGMAVMTAAVFSNLIWVFLVLRAPNATRLEWILNDN